MAPVDLLDQSLAKFQTANRIDGTRASYSKDNPAEYAKVIGYLKGSSRPAGVVSDMGVALVLAEDARREIIADGGGGGNGWFVGPRCQADFGGNVQAMIDQSPEGTSLWFEAGTYRVPSGRSVLADFSAKNSMKVRTLGKVVWQTSAGNQTLLRERSVGNVKHNPVGVMDELWFEDPSGSGMGVDVFNCDFFRLYEPRFGDGFGRGCVVFTQYKDGRLTSDNAWGVIRNGRWRSHGPAVITDFAGVTIDGGTVIGFPNSGFRFLSNSSVKMIGTMTAMEGQHILLEGGVSTLTDLTLEQYNKAGMNVPVIEIRKSADKQADGSPWPQSGNNNTIDRTTITPHDWGTPGTLVRISDDNGQVWGNKLDLVLVTQNPQSKVDNQGTNTILNIR